ncbi:MAG: type II secretion system F family protein [Candidatus Micrarchaeota archaeon]|nr:type II secretion system F family protein [Candidatus Micrarchaeota archaeon]
MPFKVRESRAESRPPAKAPQPLVAQPIREVEGPKDPVAFRNFFNTVASYFPNLRKHLIQADMHYTPAGFIQHSFISAAYLTIILGIIFYLFLRNAENGWLFTILLVPLTYIAAFIYMLYYPVAKAKMRARLIDQELVFAGRHMLIELKGGVPLFDAMLGISKDYGEVSREFNKIVEKVTLGVPIGQALHEVADSNPSQYFNRVVLQMANSLASGSDVAEGLQSSLDQISKEQIIALREYGQKLNPLVMFFMIFGIIMPSLGVAFVIILSSFIGGMGLAGGSSTLFGILLAIGLVQFIFLTMIESSRPRFDIG